MDKRLPISRRNLLLGAAALGVPIAIVNQGPTGGDADALLTVDAPLGATLTGLTALLEARSGPEPGAQ
ncbi:hypothetical protein [Nonomuraea turkmeniaca]|uniref:hypothetical protein n=1 Tax=Nonomuraea turkmeniaca TaxID=103838 RepID=UPI001B880F11|nr:hypothetical protein [Nonomuraea turkmeniaca]